MVGSNSLKTFTFLKQKIRRFFDHLEQGDSPPCPTLGNTVAVFISFGHLLNMMGIYSGVKHFANSKFSLNH